LAIESFNRFIQSYPADERVEDAELGIQSCYYRSGRDMEEYLVHNPDSALAADVYWNKGQDAFGQGDFTAAANSFEKVTLDYPESESASGALFYLAESYYRSETMDQALAGFRNFVITHPEHELAELAQLRSATVLFKQEKYMAAAQSYETLTDLFPQGEYTALAAYNAAICYQEIEDWHSAINGYERFMADYPNHENAQGLWLTIASLNHDELGDYPAAVEAYDHALDRGETGLAEVRYRQGECREKEGDMVREAKAIRPKPSIIGLRPLMLVASPNGLPWPKSVLPRLNRQVLLGDKYPVIPHPSRPWIIRAGFFVIQVVNHFGLTTKPRFYKVIKSFTVLYCQRGLL